MSVPPIDDVLFHVIQTETCWFWARPLAGNGRAYYFNQLVYRILFEHIRGPIPAKRVLDHVVCDNPACVNPWHVEPRTQKQNLGRANIVSNFGIYAEKGNPLSAVNLGDFIGRTDRQRDALGQFTGG